MGGPGGDDDDGVIDVDLSGAVDDEAVDQGPLGRCLYADTFDVFLGHAGIIFECHAVDGYTVIKVAHGADEAGGGAVVARGQFVLLVRCDFSVGVER